MISLSVARQATFATAFTIALGCGYDSTTTPYPPNPPGPSLQDGLWTASAFNPTIMRLAPTQLLTSGARAPETAITSPSAELFELNGIAFDTDGTMWVTSQDDSTLVAFPPAALGRSGSANASVVISSNGALSAPTGLAFDKQHRLWVANASNGTIVRFDRAQLATSGSPTPAVIIAGLGQPAALAFDAGGSLWYSDARRSKLAKFSAAQLETSGFLAPEVVISALAASINNPAGIAFDAEGNLWVGNVSNQNVIAFSPAQLATTGSPVPRVVLSSNAGSLDVPVGLAFDANGALWVMGATGVLDKFPKTSLGATGAPAPSVQITLHSFTVFWSLAFWPTPASLPLN